jgi:hypothetical protein
MAEAAAEQLPADVEPAAACRLLLTAAKWGHAAAVQHMAGMPMLQQLVDNDSWTTVLEAALVHIADIERRNCVSAPLKMPVAQQLSSSRRDELMIVAVQCRANSCMQQLLDLPSRPAVSSETMAHLLLAALLVNSASCVYRLRKLHNTTLPEAQRLDVDEVTSVLMSAAGRDSAIGDSKLTAMQAFIGWLLLMPLAEDLSSTLSVLVAEVVREGGFGLKIDVETLCELPAAWQLSSMDVSALLKVAAKGDEVGTERAVELLCELPSAQWLSSSSVADLLESFVSQDESAVHHMG